jgi:hypothetical protein
VFERFRRREAPEVTREDVNAIMVALMRLDAKIEELRRLIEDVNGEGREEPES